MTQTGRRIVQSRTVKPKRRVQPKRPSRTSVLDQAVAALPGGSAMISASAAPAIRRSVRFARPGLVPRFVVIVVIVRPPCCT